MKVDPEVVRFASISESLPNPFASGDFIGRAALGKAKVDQLKGLLPGCGSYLEIGTLFGGSAILAGQLCSGHIHCIDPLDGYYGSGEPDPICGLIPSEEILYQNWDAAGLSLERLFLYQHRTPPLPGGVPDRVDVVMIDGDHSLEGCMADWNLVRGLADRYIIFDDLDQLSVRHVFQLAAESSGSGWEKYWATEELGVLRRVNGGA